MGLYSYEVADKTGSVSSGQIEAANEFVVYSKLQQLGFKITDIKEVKPLLTLSFFKIEPKVKLGDLSLFSRQLAAMLNAGIPLTLALFTLSGQITNKTFQKTMAVIAGNVESGMSFSEALSAYPHIFSKLYIGMIRAGEIAEHWKHHC